MNGIQAPELRSTDFSGLAPVSRAERMAAGLPVSGAAPVAASAPPAAAAPAPAPTTGFPPAPAGGPSPAIPGAVDTLPVHVPAAIAAVRTSLRFVGGRLRHAAVPIDSPVEDHDGRVWTEIPLRRPTAKEVGDFFEGLADLAARDPDAVLHFPIYGYPDQPPVPREVIAFLDIDDQERVAEAAEDFLPDRLRRFRAALQRLSTPPAGDSTAQTSST